MTEDNKEIRKKPKKEKYHVAAKKDVSDSRDEKQCSKKDKDIDAVTTATEIFTKRWLDNLRK